MKLLPIASCAVLLFACTAGAASLPEDLESLFTSLKEAQAKKDVEQVKKLAADASALARKIQAEPAPEGLAETWGQTVAHAKEIDTYTEYALSATAAGAPPATVIDLLSTLEKQNPKSKYLDEAYGSYLVALNQTGAASKIPAIAEKGLANFPGNVDLLLVVMENAVSRKQTARAGALAERAIVSIGKSKNAGARGPQLGRAYLISALAHVEKHQDFEANKDLRSALPLVKDDATSAQVLFYLGVVNYNLGRVTNNKAQVLEAVKFSEKCSAMGAGEVSQMAWRNVQAMRADAAKMR